MADRPPSIPREELADIARRLRQALDLQSVLRDGRAPSPIRPGTPAPAVNTAPARPTTPAPRAPSPAATVHAHPSSSPGPSPAARVEAAWARDPGGFDSLGGLHDAFGDCARCSLAKARTNFVFGVGNPDANVMFIGEAPGRDEDVQGEPFVGAAGKLLNQILEAIGFAREDVYIANILKCRPPGNRDPQPNEIAACSPILARQIDLIRPVVLCTLGAFAARTLLGVNEGISRLRGRTHLYRGIPVFPTYHPAALLRNASWKRPTWEDVQRLKAEHDRRLAATAGAEETSA